MPLERDANFDSDISEVDEKLPIIDMVASRSPSPSIEKIIESQSQEWFVKKDTTVKIENFDNINIGPVEDFSTNYTANNQPIDYFNLLVDDEVFESISLMVNKYGNERYGTPDASKKSRYLKWTSTNVSEMKEVFALFAYMSMVKMPCCRYYWSTDDVFSQKFPSSVMSRNRFLQLKISLKISKSSIASNIISLIVENFQKYYKPSEILYIDDVMLYSNSGSKIVLLCSDSGYIYNSILISGVRILGSGIMIPEKSIMRLCEPILKKGHTVNTGDMLTSITLADILLQNDTHLVGMLHKERKGIPDAIKNKNLEVGEFISRVNANGTTLIRWYDGQDLMMLSTKHTDKIIEYKAQKNRGDSDHLPEMFIDYRRINKTKNSFYPCTEPSPVHRGSKWYKRIIIEFIINYAMHNAYVLYSEINKNGMNPVDFRKEIIRSLSKTRKSEVVYLEDPISTVRASKRAKHELMMKEGSKRNTRRTCVSCYYKNSRERGRKFAKNSTVKVATYCDDCENKPHLCLSCFNEIHRD